MNPTTPRSNRPLIISSVIAILVIGLGYGAYIHISRNGKIGYTIYLAPANAKLTIDGKSAGSGTHYLTPGSHNISASKDGFATNAQTVMVSDSEPHQHVLPLTPQTEAAKTYANKHKADYLTTEKIGGEIVAESGLARSSAAPISDLLPYTDTYYQIGYLSNPDGSLKVTVHSTSPRFRYEAMQQIKDWGYDPTTLDIDFTDYKNPLGN